jgi:hypothetical protein
MNFKRHHIHSGVESTVTEMKNSLDGFNCGFQQAEK